MRKPRVAFTRPDAIDYRAHDLAYSIILLHFSRLHQGEDGLARNSIDREVWCEDLGPTPVKPPYRRVGTGSYFSDLAPPNRQVGLIPVMPVIWSVIMISYRPDAVKQKQQRGSTDLSLLVINISQCHCGNFRLVVGVNFGAKIPTNVSTLITRLLGLTWSGLELIDSAKLKLIVETVLPLSEARKAHELNERGHVRGQIVLKVA